ncbi:MAG: hypothetical protein ISS26_02010 [Candidatus Omnitrophica bacterium]|nr:hypothetical protein [Candidatus Omnitrophota bacterium]
MKLKNHFEATGIGSIPYNSEREACDLIFSKFKRIPFWPQLVNKSFLEDMMAQFVERMPGIEADASAKKVSVNRNRDIRKEIDELNEHYESGDLEYFSFSEDHAAGFYEYMYRLKNLDKTMLDYLKGQVTGPVSFAFSVTDSNGIPLYFDKELCGAAIKTLALKARWQAARLKEIFQDVIIFIDEPSLVFFKQAGSRSKIKKEDLASHINTVVSAIHTEACFAGLHCCADADWDFALSTDIDLISFDAYNYGRSFAENSESIAKFFERGGIIAWGMVPTAPESLKEDIGNILERLESYIGILAQKGIDRKKIINSSLITPSCGCGTLSGEEAESVITRCVDFSQLAKERIIR